MSAGFPQTVTIYGTGLMGSSFALALRQCLKAVRIYGVDAPEILERARRLGIVETADPQESDLVILAAPVGEILKLIDELEPGPAIVLDIGSTKVEICRKAERRGLSFVGGHPLTGSEKSGPEAASAEFFQGSPFFLCPVSTTPAGVLAKLQRLIEAIGAQPHVIAAEDHDRLTAAISHLPQIVSTVLIGQTEARRDLAGPGWKSVTRLAASPFHVWKDILNTSGFLPHELRLYIERLQAVLDALERKDSGGMDEIEALFERANRLATGCDREC